MIFPALPPLLGWQILLLAYAGGLLATAHFPGAAMGALLLLFLTRKDAHLPFSRKLFPWMYAACFALGLGMGTAALPPDASHLSWTLDRAKERVHGTVDRVLPTHGGRLRVLLRDVTLADDGVSRATLPAKLLVNWDYPPLWPEPGQELTATLRVEPVRGLANPGLWDYAAWWARKGVRYRAYLRGGDEGKARPNWGPPPNNPLWTGRTALRDRVLAALGHPGKTMVYKDLGAGMILALLFGDRSGLDLGVWDAMSHASLSHSLALSGLHVGLVASLGWCIALVLGRLWPGIYLRLPRPRLAVCCAAPLVLGYVWLGQAAPSLVRAAVMFGFWGLLVCMGRGRVLIDGLFWALACLLLISPLSALDTGLQMSVLAVAGIACLLPVFTGARPLDDTATGTSRLRALVERAGRGILGILLVSLCVQAVLLPLTASSFGFATPLFFTNVLWLPWLGFVCLPLCFAGLACTLVWPGAASVLLHAASACLAWPVEKLLALDAAGGLPVVWLPRPHWAVMAGYWTLLACLVLLWRGRMDWKRLRVPALAGLLLLTVPMLHGMWTRHNQGVAVTVLDVGQNQAVIIDLPESGRVLVDASGAWPRFDMGRAVVVPALSRNRWPGLDMAVLSHPDRDHSGGMPSVLDIGRPDEFVFNNDWPGSRKAKQSLEQALVRSGARKVVAYQDDVWNLGHNISLEVLHPPAGFRSLETNERSLVLRLTWHGRGLMLLPGDVEKNGLAALLHGNQHPDSLTSDVLLLPHHGAVSSHSPDLYDRVRPSLALVSAGFLNPYGFPSPIVRQSLTARGIPLYDTASHGQLRVSWAAPDARPVLQTAR